MNTQLMVCKTDWLTNQLTQTVANNDYYSNLGYYYYPVYYTSPSRPMKLAANAAVLKYKKLILLNRRISLFALAG